MNSSTPAISTMLRGMVGEEITITGPSLDLHSGMYGGPAMNPVRVLNRILAGLHDNSGRITLPGFYAGVQELPAKHQSAVGEPWAGRHPVLQEVGLSEPAGETGYSVLEQIWARPTCDINGIQAGYTGEGFKTVLPSKAMAKISFRLVGTQDPETIRRSFHDYVKQHLPVDCSVSFKSKDGSSATVYAGGCARSSRSPMPLCRKNGPILPCTQAAADPFRLLDISRRFLALTVC